MKNIKTLFLFAFIFTMQLNAQELQCDKKEILKNFENSKAVITSRIERVQQILSGKKVDGAVFRELFGYNFVVSDTAKRIENLKFIIKEEGGVSLENKTTVYCLDKLNFQKRKQELLDLSVQLRKLEVELLKHNLELSDSVREAGVTENNLPGLKQKISQDSSNAADIKAKLENELIQNQKNNLKNNVVADEESYENELTKIKIELLDKKIKINNNLEKKIKYFESSNEELQKYAARLDEIDSKQKRINFQAVQTLWLKLSEENYQDLFSFENQLELPIIPVGNLSSDKETDKKNKLFYQELIELKQSIITSYTDKKHYELKLLNQLVTSSNAIRSKYFRELGFGYMFETLLSKDVFLLLKNEVLNTPYRILSYFYSKYLYVSEQISLGQKGYVKLLSIFFVLSLFVMIGFALRVAFSKLKEKLESFLQYIVRSKKKSYFLKKMYSFWIKIREIFIPLLWLIVIKEVSQINFFLELNLIFKAAEIYLWSIVLKSLLTTFLGSISRLDSANFSAFRQKAEETSNKFKNIFLVYFYTMIIFEMTVGRVYIYSLLNLFVLGYSLYSLIKESSKWEKEFTIYSEKKFSGVFVEKYTRMLSLIPQKLRAFFLLVFIIIFNIIDFFISITENFEISKKISANLFKKQIEKVEAKDGAEDSIPSEYKELFSPKSLESQDEYVYSAQGLEEKIYTELDEWFHETSDEHSLVIYGEKGIGKTTLLKHVANNVKEKYDLDIIYGKIPSKTATSEKLKSFFTQILNCEEEEKIESQLYTFDQALEKKTLIVLDEAQNIFFGHAGGFKAYYELTKLVNLNCQNIFWILSFNKYSWLYLDRAFGRTQFFRNIFEVKGWTDDKIKELILKRHNKSEFKLSYDLLISATKSQDEIDKYSSIESKFFKLLWEMSNGNPRSAIFLWVSALSPKARNYFNVNIPRDVELGEIEKLPDELMFVIADIIKHENLSAKEITATTNLPEGIVRNAVRLGIEQKFFYRDKRKRYMVDISTQYGVTRYLKIKNFIYGN